MVKANSGKKKKPREQRSSGAGYVLNFIFSLEGGEPVSLENLEKFAGKLNQEHRSRAKITAIDTGPVPEQQEHPLISFLDPGTLNRSEPAKITDQEYAVILDPHVLKGQLNPNEFFRLQLPQDGPSMVFFKVLFKGKKEEQESGVIVPAALFRYLLIINGYNHLPDPGSVRMVAKKLGFEQREVTLHQEVPATEEAKKSTRLLKKIKLDLAWNTTLPLKEARDPNIKTLFFTKEHPLFRLAFLITAVAIFILLPILSQDAGLSGDDEKHYQHAIKVHRYFTEDDPSALNDPKYKLNFYGQSFDYFTYLVIKLFNLEDHPYEARHAMVAITGAAAILVTGLLVKIFAGYAGGWLALLLMFLSPRFLGHAYNNSMDVPFALGNIFFLYHLILFLRKLPRISGRSAVWIAIGIGWSNGIRIGGLLLIPYLFMFSGLYLLFRKWPWKKFSAAWWRFAMKGLFTLVAISVAGYLLSLLTWPYALQDIINHPIQAFKVMTNIQVSIRVLYDGLIYWSDRLPWHYIPQNILISVPVVILLGWLSSLYAWYMDRKTHQGYWYFMLWFTVLFPVLFIIYRKSNVYGGWRHMMFIYPSMLALAAMSITRLAKMSKKGWVPYTIMLLVAAGLFHPLRHIIHNHPNTYIYFNEWSGGINHTYGTFETDYYANSLRPATDYFKEKILPEIRSRTDGPVKVVSNAGTGYYFRNYAGQVEPRYTRYYSRGNMDWDYAILYCNYIHPYQLNHGLWPPRNTIHEVKVDDVVVAAIVERKNRDDYLGAHLMNECIRKQDVNCMKRSINLLENAVRYDEHNEAALLSLGNAYSSAYRFKEARATMDRLLEFYPEYDKALGQKGYYYMVEAKLIGNESLLDLAVRTSNRALVSNYKFSTAYYVLGLCYYMKEDKYNAIYNLKQSIRYNARYKDAYVKLAEVYEHFGEHELAGSVRAELNRLQ